MNKWIFAGSLGAVFLVTLGFSYGPGYGSSLSAILGGNASISSEVSPSDMVTPMVTVKKMVTSKIVTNVTSVSPTMSPIVFNNSQSPSISPTVSPRVATITPAVSPQPSPMASAGTVSRTPTPVVSPSPTATPEPTTPSPTPTQTPSPNSAGVVVINEIAWMGTAAPGTTGSSDEWMELYNNTDQVIDLTGWTLKSLTGTSPDPQIVLTNSIQPFSFYLLERTDNTTVSDILANALYTGSLLDTGENLELRDSLGLLIDIVRSEGLWYAGNKDSRSSMERIDSGKLGDDSTNWATNNGITKNGHDASGNIINGTPLLINSGSGS